MTSRAARTDLHDLASTLLLPPAIRASRLARGRTRPLQRAYDQGLAFRRASTSWSDDRRRDWVLERLRTVARRAAATSPFWAERFAAAGFDPRADFGFDDYARLPILDRPVVRAAGESLLSSAVPRDRMRKDATGGSTGTPTVVWKGPEEEGWYDSAIAWNMERIGVRPGARTAYLWGHHLDPVTRETWRDRMQDTIYNTAWFDAFRLTPAVLLDYHRRLATFSPVAIIAYASALGALADAIAAAGIELQAGYPRRAFVTGAEKLFPHHRARIAEVFGRPVHERYGGRDVGLLAFQQDPERTLDYTIDWSCVLVEPDAPGADAGVIVTKLRADAMPLFRYRIGDVARFPADAVPGTPALRLHDVLGRDVARLLRRDGGWVHGASMPHMMKDFPVLDFQVLQQADRSIVVSIVPAAGYTAADGERIVRTIAGNLPDLSLELRLVDDIPRTAANKWQPVISHAVA